MECEFLHQGNCQVAGQLVQLPCLTNPSACRACLACDTPKAINHVTVSLALNSLPRPIPPEFEHLKLRLRKPHIEGWVKEYRRTDASENHISFVYPFWQGGANYDELRWSIRSVFKNFRPADGQTFNVVIVGDQPILRRTKESWYAGQIIPSPRISKGRTFRPKLNDALHKWRTALDSELVGDMIVWMMDDIYFIQPISLESLAQPRAFKQKSAHSLARWNEKSGFSSAKKRTMELLHQAGLPMWDFATHLPHVVQRKQAMEVFDKFDILANEALWEILYENYVLGDRRPERAAPYLAYFTHPQNARQIESLAENCTVMVNGGGSWNEDLRRFLFHRFPTPAPCEILPPPPLRPDPNLTSAWLKKIADCPHRQQVLHVVKSKLCSRRGLELPVFQCSQFGRCTIDQYAAGQPEKVCKKCELMEPS
jgi:hypothetical protein